MTASGESFRQPRISVLSQVTSIRSARQWGFSAFVCLLKSGTQTSSIDESVIRILERFERLKIRPGWGRRQRGYKVKSGGFGTVEVVRCGQELLARKELCFRKGRIYPARFAKRFARELMVWAELDHPNLIKLSGFYLSPDLTVAQFFCPYYPHGNVRQYLEEHPHHDQAKRYQFAEDTAIGLEHLHEQRIVHGDLKDLNVLISNDLRAVLCDYGLAKRVNDALPSGLTTSGIPMTLKYASPELFSGERQSFGSDIWAWGCLFLKILINQDPYDGIPSNQMYKTVLVDKVAPAVAHSLELIEPLQDMLARCWDWKIQARATMKTWVDVMKPQRARQAAYSVAFLTKTHSSTPPTTVIPAPSRNTTLHDLSVSPVKALLHRQEYPSAKQSFGTVKRELARRHGIYSSPISSDSSTNKGVMPIDVVFQDKSLCEDSPVNDLEETSYGDQRSRSRSGVYGPAAPFELKTTKEMAFNQDR